MSDDSNLCPSSSIQSPSRRYAPMMKSHQSVALARLVQERKNRSVSQNSAQLNSSNPRRLLRNPRHETNKNPVRPSRRKSNRLSHALSRKPNSIVSSDTDDTLMTNTTTTTTSEERSMDGSIFTLSRCSDDYLIGGEDDESLDEDRFLEDNESLDSFSSNDRWSPSRNYRQHCGPSHKMGANLMISNLRSSNRASNNTRPNTNKRKQIF